MTPICQQVVVKAGHYVKKLVRRAHWEKRNGHRVWVKAKYAKVWVKPVYQTACH